MTKNIEFLSSVRKLLKQIQLVSGIVQFKQEAEVSVANRMTADLADVTARSTTPEICLARFDPCNPH